VELNPVARMPPPELKVSALTVSMLPPAAPELLTNPCPLPKELSRDPLDVLALNLDAGMDSVATVGSQPAKQSATEKPPRAIRRKRIGR
jgi:hypothetical protein